MRTKINKTVEITIILTEKEARYIQGLLQNYTGGDLADEDDDDDQRMRYELFEGLKEALLN